jgi:CheY-like chemotaxis protein
MTVTCPSCKTTLVIPDDRLPKGKAVTAGCPQCKGKIVIGPTETPPAPDLGETAVLTPELPASYSVQRQRPALVCVSAPAERDQVVAALKAEGYAPLVATSAAHAIQQLRFTAYALAVIREGFGTPAGDGNPVLDHVAEMPMASRRTMNVVFISPSITAHYSTAAFAKSVNLVLNLNDLSHLTEALKQSVPEMEQANRVLLESLRAQGKA